MILTIISKKRLPKKYLIILAYHFKEKILDEMTNNTKLNIFNKQIKENKAIVKLNPKSKDIDIKIAIKEAIDNIKIKRFKDIYIFELGNVNKTYPGYNIKINTLCKMLNDGSFTTKPIPIFDKAFKYIKKHSKKFYREYETLYPMDDEINVTEII